MIGICPRIPFGAIGTNQEPVASRVDESQFKSQDQWPVSWFNGAYRAKSEVAAVQCKVQSPVRHEELLELCIFRLVNVDVPGREEVMGKCDKMNRFRVSSVVRGVTGISS